MFYLSRGLNRGGGLSSHSWSSRHTAQGELLKGASPLLQATCGVETKVGGQES